MGTGLVWAANRAGLIGASTLQIFSDNPTAWRRRSGPHPDAELFRARLAELDLAPLSVHAAYLVNLAGPDPDLFAQSVELVRAELDYAPRLGAAFINVHAGSHRGSGAAAGILRLVEGIARAFDRTAPGPDAPLITVENSSGGGDAIGITVEQLAEVLEAAALAGVDGRIRFCLDTAHLWGAGHDISTTGGVDAVLDRFAELIGLDRLAAVHLNDTVSGLASRHDRHTHLGDGQIGPAGLARMLTHPGLDHVAFYLETPGMEDGFDALNLARVGDLAAGRALTPGPERPT